MCSPACTVTLASASLVQPAGEVICRLSMTIRPGSPSTTVMRLSTGCSSSQVITARRKLATRNSVARQSAMELKLSTNQRSEDWTCMNAPEAIIRPPKEMVPAKYSGAATRIGATSVNQP